MEEIIIFFKNIGLYEEKMFNDIEKNLRIIDDEYENIKCFVGCYKIDSKKFKIILPIIKNKTDLLIYVHEITHVIFLDEETEVIPNIIEAIFINENFTPKERMEILKKEIMHNDIDHIIGEKIKKMLIKI